MTRTRKDIIIGERGSPKMVDRSILQAELDALRAQAKAHTKASHAIIAARRRLPMSAVHGATSRGSANMGE